MALQSVVLNRAPSTYQEWIDCFAYIRSHPNDRAYLVKLSDGSFHGDSQMLDMYLRRLDDTLREMISARITRFLAQIDELFAENDLDGVEVLSVRFCRDISACFFFKELSGIPQKQKTEFADGFSEQLQQFWSRLIREMKLQAEEHRNDELEELAFRLARLNGEWNRKGRQ